MLFNKNLTVTRFILIVNMTVIVWIPCLSWATDKITRQAIMTKAKAYANYRFYVSQDNITAFSGENVGGKLVITPFSKPGHYVGIPYKWGGNDSLDSFQKGLTMGKKAEINWGQSKINFLKTHNSIPFLSQLAKCSL
jgi:hypothetical protein